MPAHSVQRSRRILIADDNPDVADSLALLLQLDGHTVTVVNDGESALREIENGTPEVVILDIGMPGMDGYEVARRARVTFGQSITLIAITGWGQVRDKAEALEAGFDYHFTKPVEPDEIGGVLQKIGTLPSEGG